MKDSKEKEHRISDLKDMIDNVTAESYDEMEEDSELIDYLNGSDTDFEESEIDDEFIYGMITNSRSVGGMKKITGPDVDLNDGLFEVTLIKRPNNMIELNKILAALVNENYDTDLIYTFKTDELKMAAEQEIAWTLDGEFGGNHKELVLKNRKKAMHIMVKQDF